MKRKNVIELIEAAQARERQKYNGLFESFENQMKDHSERIFKLERAGGPSVVLPHVSKSERDWAIAHAVAKEEEVEESNKPKMKLVSFKCDADRQPFAASMFEIRQLNDLGIMYTVSSIVSRTNERAALLTLRLEPTYTTANVSSLLAVLNNIFFHRFKFTAEVVELG